MIEKMAAFLEFRVWLSNEPFPNDLVFSESDFLAEFWTKTPRYRCIFLHVWMFLIRGKKAGGWKIRSFTIIKSRLNSYSSTSPQSVIFAQSMNLVWRCNRHIIFTRRSVIVLGYSSAKTTRIIELVAYSEQNWAIKPRPNTNTQIVEFWQNLHVVRSSRMEDL